MNELYHYGVKGMKWGVRKKTHNSSNRSRKKEIKNIKLSSVDKNVIKKGRNFMQSQNIQQQMVQRFIDWSMQETTRASINASNQAASLAMTGGMNPFMFGMM